MRGNSFKKKAMLIIMLLILSRFIVVGMENVKENWNAIRTDQRAYLRLGLKIKEGTALTDGARHPLYPTLISFFAEREWAYFTKAKLLSLAIGTATLLIVYALSRRMYNDDVALIASLLLSINGEFGRQSSKAICEPLLVLLTFLTWHFTVKGFSDRRQWIIAGFLGGLAYLTKGSGSLLLLAFLISNAIIHRGKLIRRDVLLFPLFFLIASLPLLVYNFEVYRNPFYNVNTAHVMWFDRWEDKHKLGENPPTVFTYLKTHTLGEVVKRELTGMKRMASLFLLALAPAGMEFISERPTLLLPLGIAAMAALLYFRREVASYCRANKGKVAFTLTLIALFYLLFSWHSQVTPSPRFMTPLAPIVYFFFGELVYAVGRGISKRVSIFKTAVYPALWAVVALWLCVTSAEAASHLFEDPFQSDVLRNAPKDNALLWLRERAEGPMLRGPGKALPTWKYPELHLRSIPKLDAWEDFVEYLTSRGIRYVVFDAQTLSKRPFLRRYFYREGEGVDFSALPPGWRLAFAYKGLPCQWCIFRLILPKEMSIDHRLDVSLDQKVRLLGYDLDTWRLKPEGEKLIQLTLYWQALAEIDEDYTVFTHLLGEDGKIWGQMDSQPVRGRRPTSTWQPGEVIIDHYHILPLPDVPPGEYRIEVGMYLLETMERLPLYEGGRRLPEDRVLLEPAITINDS